jgi:hypothetical protein
VTNFAPVISGTITSADKNKITLPWLPAWVIVGAKVAVVGAGTDGGTLGGETGFESGVPITDVTGLVITLGESADALLTYPLTVSVTRWADVSTFSGFADLQDDSSGIIAMRILKRVLFIYRTTGIFSGRFSGVVESPFIFTPEYTGFDVPIYRDCIGELEGDAHVYPSVNRFYYFDGSGNPTVFTPLDNARTLFFTTPGTRPVAVNNQATRELWFCAAAGVLAYSYQSKTASYFDVVVKGLTVDGLIATTNAVVAHGGATRLGVAITAVLKTGDIGDLISESDLLSFGFYPATGTALATVTEIGYGRNNQAAAQTTLFTESVLLPNSLPITTSCFRDHYFALGLTVSAAFNLSAWTVTLNPVNSMGAARVR